MSGGGTNFRIGVDIGGTFTDIVLLTENGILFSKKLLSTPHDYSEAIEQGVLALMAETGVTASHIAEFFDGTTVATNAIIERRRYGAIAIRSPEAPTLRFAWRSIRCARAGADEPRTLRRTRPTVEIRHDDAAKRRAVGRITRFWRMG